MENEQIIPYPISFTRNYDSTYGQFRYIIYGRFSTSYPSILEPICKLYTQINNLDLEQIKLIESLLMSNDLDNYKIAEEILKTKLNDN